jgi:hypothetical protein
MQGSSVVVGVSFMNILVNDSCLLTKLLERSRFTLAGYLNRSWIPFDHYASTWNSAIR